MDASPVTADEQARLDSVVAVVDAYQSRLPEPRQLRDETGLMLAVAGLGPEFEGEVVNYRAPDGDGWEMRSRLVKDGAVYARSYQKGPDVSRTHDLVVTYEPGPMTRLPDGQIEDADVVVKTWVERGWRRVDSAGRGDGATLDASAPGAVSQ